MIVELEYGRGRIPVRMPDGCEVTVLRKNPLPVIDDTAGAVERSFAEPTGAPPLASLARGRRSACILVCDITRPVPNHAFLGPMIRILTDSGIPARNITVLVATGLHRPNEGEELAELVGDPWVLGTVRVENHFARDAAAHVDLGVTATKGTPVKLDRRFVEAELRIATGLVEPHFMAGWSGGRKVVAPGVAHEDTIRTFHNARFMEDPAAIQCNLDGNPLHEEQLEIMRMLGEVHAVNTVIDERRRMCFLNFGEVAASHLEAVRFVHDSCVVPVGREVLDRRHLRRGLSARPDLLPDREGHGHTHRHPRTGREPRHRLGLLRGDRFAPSTGRRSAASSRAARTNFSGASSTSRSRTSTSGRPRCSSSRCASPASTSTRGGLPEEDRGLTGVNVVDSIEDAVTRSVEASGDPAVAVIPEGPYVVPRFAAHAG